MKDYDGNNIIRADIAYALNKETGIPLNDCADIVDDVFDELVKGLVKDGEVKVKKFGTFSVRHKKARVGRNPKTGVETTICSRNVVTFHPSKLFKDELNG